MTNDAPIILPSGRYAVDTPDALPFEGTDPSPLVQVLQLIENSKAPEFAEYDGKWFTTPGRWRARTLLESRPTRLALDFGAGWVLDEADTAALLELAEEVAR